MYLYPFTLWGPTVEFFWGFFFYLFSLYLPSVSFCTFSLIHSFLSITYWLLGCFLSLTIHFNEICSHKTKLYIEIFHSFPHTQRLVTVFCRVPLPHSSCCYHSHTPVARHQEGFTVQHLAQGHFSIGAGIEPMTFPSLDICSWATAGSSSTFFSLNSDCVGWNRVIF